MTDNGALIIVNNEAGFQKEHVSAISDVRKSTKSQLKDLGYIGEKGVGFKSVFMVCCPILNILTRRLLILLTSFLLVFNSVLMTHLTLKRVSPTSSQR